MTEVIVTVIAYDAQSTLYFPHIFSILSIIYIYLFLEKFLRKN